MTRLHAHIITCAICASLATTGLAACSCSKPSSAGSDATVVTDAAGSGASTSTVGTGTTTSQDDQSLIRANADETLASLVDAGRLAESLRSLEEMGEMEAAGFDVDAYSTSVADSISYEVTDVAVFDDVATATVKLTIPDFGEAGNAILQEEVESGAADIEDPDNMGDLETTALYMNAIARAYARDDFPKAETTLEIDYVRGNDGWAIQDYDMVQASIDAIMGA